MKKNVFTLNIIAMVIVVSLFCTENKAQRKDNTGLHVVDIDAAEPITGMKTSQLFKKVTPIILEVKPNSLIRGIDKLYIMDELLIIMHTYPAAVAVFNRDGKFLHNIGGRGQGPGEYTDISDFCVDTVSKTIYLSEFNTKKIHHYDLYSGKHLKSIKLNANITNWHIYYHENELYMSCKELYGENKERFLLHKIDINSGNIKDAWFDFRDYNKGVENAQNPFLHTNQKEMKFATNLMDTVMSISGNKVMPFLTFSDKYKTTKGDVKNVDMSEFPLNKLKDKIIRWYYYFECPDFLFLMFSTGNNNKILLYYPETKHAKNIRSFIDDLVYSDQRRAMPIFVAADRKGMYASIHTLFIAKFIETRDKGELSPSLSNNPEIQKLDEEANPIILYYEFQQ
jgi:hypothetical protein